MKKFYQEKVLPIMIAIIMSLITFLLVIVIMRTITKPYQHERIYLVSKQEIKRSQVIKVGDNLIYDGCVYKKVK
jgi:hypothetical protein